MSLSNPPLKNPASRIFQWAGSTGDLAFYDRETKQNIKIKLPFTFIVLDQLATIGGYSKRLESGIWANEVRNTMNETFYVKTKKGPVEAGKYRDLTETTKLGGKYAASIYIAFEANKAWHIGKFLAMGSALSAWIEFRKAYDAGAGKVTMVRGDQLEAQTGPYFPPKYSLEKWEDSEYDAAVKLDETLQIYLEKALKLPRDEEGNELLNDDAPATVEQQQDFARRKAEAGMNGPEIEDYTPPSSTRGLDSARAKAAAIKNGNTAPAQEDPVFDPGDEPIDLDDIPF